MMSTMSPSEKSYEYGVIRFCDLAPTTVGGLEYEVFQICYILVVHTYITQWNIIRKMIQL